MGGPAARPVLALDVDGVLNPGSRDSAALVDAGYVAHDVFVPVEEVPNSPFVQGGGREPLSGTVYLHPMHAEWLRQVERVADVVWATTWEEAANTHLAPLLGVGPYPVGISLATNPPRFGDARNGYVDAWKATALADNFPGRALAWVDDRAAMYVEVPGPSQQEREALEAEFGPMVFETPPPWRKGPTLVVAPDPKVGLSVEDMARVLAWLTDPSGASGAAGGAS